VEVEDWKRLPPWVDMALLCEGIRRPHVAEVEWTEDPRTISVRLHPKPQDVEITIVRAAG
jgi:hypothetical protein